MSINQQGALKFVFLAGGPGVGKNYIANQLFGIEPGTSFGSTGMKMISFDTIFEKVLEKHGYPSDLTELQPEDAQKVMNEFDPDSLWSISRRIMKKQLANNLKSGNGIIFDGTGRLVHGTLNKKDQAEDLGYDTYLIFVNVPLKTALKRNRQRARRLPDKMVHDIHQQVKQNFAEYKRIFGDRLIVVDNHEGKQITAAIQTKIDAIVGTSVKNPRGEYRIRHNGQLPPREKPAHRADPTPTPQVWHSDWDGTHGWVTADGWTDSQTELPLHPGEVYHEKKAKMAMDQSVDYDISTPNKAQKPKSWWDTFKQKQGEKFKNWFGSDDEDTKLSNLAPTEDKIYNPETGNYILITTALGYAPNHPMRIEAEKLLNKKNKPTV